MNRRVIRRRRRVQDQREKAFGAAGLAALAGVAGAAARAQAKDEFAPVEALEFEGVDDILAFAVICAPDWGPGSAIAHLGHHESTSFAAASFVDEAFASRFMAGASHSSHDEGHAGAAGLSHAGHYAASDHRGGYDHAEHVAAHGGHEAVSASAHGRVHDEGDAGHSPVEHARHGGGRGNLFAVLEDAAFHQTLPAPCSGGESAEVAASLAVYLESEAERLQAGAEEGEAGRHASAANAFDIDFPVETIQPPIAEI